jgi:hypothetical protein
LFAMFSVVLGVSLGVFHQASAAAGYSSGGQALSGFYRVTPVDNDRTPARFAPIRYFYVTTARTSHTWSSP